MLPAILQSCIRIEILQLREREKGGCTDDVDAKNRGEAVMIYVEGILEGEAVLEVAVHGACIFYYVNVFRWPACGQIGDYCLLQQSPIAREANKQRCRDIHMWVWGRIPWWYWRDVRRRLGGVSEGKIVGDWRYICVRWRFVKWFGLFAGWVDWVSEGNGVYEAGAE